MCLCNTLKPQHAVLYNQLLMINMPALLLTRQASFQQEQPEQVQQVACGEHHRRRSSNHRQALAHLSKKQARFARTHS